MCIAAYQARLTVCPLFKDIYSDYEYNLIPIINYFSPNSNISSNNNIQGIPNSNTNSLTMNNSSINNGTNTIPINISLSINSSFIRSYSITMSIK